MLDDVEAVECRAEVDAVKDHLGDVAVVDARRFEDDGSIVEEVVGSGQLLEHLKKHAERDAVTHAWCVEHIVPFCERIAFVALSGELGLDLFELHGDAKVIWACAVDFCHGGFSLVGAAFAVGVSGCFREEKYAAAEDGGEDKTKADRKAPRDDAMALVFVDAEVDA